MSKSIAIVNQKGGVGKSWLSAELSASCSNVVTYLNQEKQQEGKVLLLVVDDQLDSPTFVGADVKNNLVDLGEFINSPSDGMIQTHILKDVKENLDVTWFKDLDSFENNIVKLMENQESRSNTEDAFYYIKKKIHDKLNLFFEIGYTYIIVDMPPGLSLVPKLILDWVNEVILISTTEAPSIRNTSKVYRKMRDSEITTDKIKYLVINRHKNNNDCLAGLEILRKTYLSFGLKIFGPIPDSVKFSRPHISGRTLCETDMVTYQTHVWPIVQEVLRNG